jgi:hypothetical protein
MRAYFQHLISCQLGSWLLSIAKGETYQAKSRKIFLFFEPEHSKERPKVEAGKVDYAPFTYILASDQLEAGKTVINLISQALL